MSRLIVERRPASDFDDVFVYNVRSPHEEAWQGVGVWWRPNFKEARCCSCSGPLAAMLASCVHARAVKRAATKKDSHD